jgi:hypothetical protein
VSPETTLPVLMPAVPGQRWACHSCGNCCRSLTGHLFEEERRRLDAQRWEPILGVPPYVRLGQGFVLVQREMENQALREGISETLAGRVAILNLLGLSNRERRKRNLDVPPFLPTPTALKARETDATALTLKRAYADIWLGCYPALVTKAVRDRDLFYSSYLQTDLQRDLRDLARVGSEAIDSCGNNATRRNAKTPFSEHFLSGLHCILFAGINSFIRFLKACAARTAQMLNLSDLARDADIAVNTAKNWLSILQVSFQVALLQPYHWNVTKRLVKAPKLYFLDTGLCSYLANGRRRKRSKPVR